MPNVTNSPNHFAVDYQVGEVVMDINNPPQKKVPFQPFPRLVYHHGDGRVEQVNNEKEQAAMLKRNFQLKASPKHDYSRMTGNVAAVAAPSKPREQELTPAQLAALEDEKSA
jgi:hypothetical protein